MNLTDNLKYILNSNESEDVFYENYRSHLVKLNKIIKKTSDYLEGNIFYFNDAKDLSELHLEFKDKRKNTAKIANLVDVIVEIGFNAGHSALLILSSNNDIMYKGVDINCHAYTVPCFNHLKNYFQDRIDLSLGNSLDVLPKIFDIYPEIKNKKIGWIIDGCHDIDVANKDLETVLELCSRDDIILFDDSEHGGKLRNLIDMYVLSDKIKIILDYNRQVFLKKI
jgi:hypothetical protein